MAVTANGAGWSGPGTVSVVLGRGDGTFEAAQSSPTAQGPKGTVVADFNGDHHRDIATVISGGWRQTNQVSTRTKPQNRHNDYWPAGRRNELAGPAQPGGGPALR